jgi:hypothetical protein
MRGQRYENWGMTLSANSSRERLAFSCGSPPRENAPHEKVDAECFVVLADLVSHFFRVADDGGVLECLLVGERQQVLTDAPIELVLRRRHAGRIRDEAGLLLKEPPGGLSHVFARLTRGFRHVDDLVKADVRTQIRALGLTPRLTVLRVALAQNIERREGRGG